MILYLTYWFPGARRAKMVALFMTAIGTAQLIGSPVSGGIMQYMDGVNGWRGWQWLFLLEGIPSVIIGVLVLAILPNGPKTAKWLTVQERDLLVQRIEQDNTFKEGLAGKHSLFGAFKDGRVWALAAVYFALATCFYAVGFWMPTIIQELGIDKKDLLKVGLISMIPWGASIVSMIYWGSHSDRTRERRWHCATGMLCTMTGLLVRWRSRCHLSCRSSRSADHRGMGRLRGDILVAAYRFSIRHRRRRRHCMDQLRGQSRRLLRPGSDRHYSNRSRRRDRGGVLHTGSAGAGRCAHHPSFAQNAAYPSHDCNARFRDHRGQTLIARP